MPTLEDQLRRYGDVLDGVADRTGEPVKHAIASRPRRAVRTALVAVAVVLVVSLIAVVSTTRSTHEPAPATAPIGPSTTTPGQTTTTTTPTPSDAQAEAWITEHGGRVIDLHHAGDLAMSDRAVYTLSLTDAATNVPTTLSRVDRQTLHVVSVPAKNAVDVSVGGGAVYLVTSHRADSSVQRLDPDSLQPLWTFPVVQPNESSPPQVAGDARGVWVAFDNQLEQLDPQSGTVRRGLASSTTDPNVGESIALDPTGNILYVVYGQGGGATEPIEMRDAHTGARLAFNPDGPGGLGPPQIAATDAGVWVAYRTGTNGEASFFRVDDLKRSAELVVGGTSGFGMGVALAAAGTTLWAANVRFIACADARTGQSSAELTSDMPRYLEVFSIAADATGVAASIYGTLGVFKPGDLCPGA